jgi:hypothetical protein
MLPVSSSDGMLLSSTVAGFRDFDNILYAWLTLFQYMTNTDWTANMYDLWDGANWWTWPLCIMMVRREDT